MDFIEDRHDVTQLKYFCFNTSNPGRYLNHCQSAYKLWRQQWIQTFGDLDSSKQLTSDDFIDRELCGLFQGEQAIGFMLCKFMDLRRYPTIDLLYFKNYPQSLIDRNLEKQDPIMIMSYMTLDPTWRKSNTNYSVSELLIGFMILRLNNSEAHRAVGYFRNNRSTNEIFYRHSGHFLLRHYAYNVDVDYAEADPQTSTLSSYSSHALLNLKLWNEFYETQRSRYELETSTEPSIGQSPGRRIPEPTMEP